MESVEKLLSMSSEPLALRGVSVSIPDFESYGRLGVELLDLLRHKNGFYAFESALHVFPAASFDGEMTLSRWNSFGLWRREYGDLAARKLFFAEDACGNQFCLADGKVCFFDAEIGRVENLAGSIEGWAAEILRDYNTLTSYALMYEWQMRNGPLPPCHRLMLKKPLALGGKYSLDNIFLTDSVEGMRLRGSIAAQIKGLPDGSQVRFRFIDD
jgi:hypothetical protein